MDRKLLIVTVLDEKKEVLIEIKLVVQKNPHIMLLKNK